MGVKCLGRITVKEFNEITGNLTKDNDRLRKENEILRNQLIHFHNYYKENINTNPNNLDNNFVVGGNNCNNINNINNHNIIKFQFQKGNGNIISFKNYTTMGQVLDALRALIPDLPDIDKLNFLNDGKIINDYFIKNIEIKNIYLNGPI